MKTVPIDMLRQLISANFLTGELFWLPRTPELFKSDGKMSQELLCQIFNRRYAGKRALVCQRPDGYFMGRMFNCAFYAHRVLWALHSGEWPSAEIDHIDGQPSNNSISNLREASHRLNMYNRRKASNNKSGFKGVSWHKEYEKWRVTINRRSIGYFKDIEDARRAYAEAALQFHGEFASKHESKIGLDA